MIHLLSSILMCKKLGQSFGIYRQRIWEEKLKIRFVQDFVTDQWGFNRKNIEIVEYYCNIPKEYKKE
jgi:hypothetical protein